METYSLEPNDNRLVPELLMMGRFLKFAEPKFQEWAALKGDDTQANLRQVLAAMTSPDHELVLTLRDVIRELIETYNSEVRLCGIPQIESLEGQYATDLLPCPTPCDAVNPALPWVGHGFFWKSSDSPSLDKDLGFEDFDCIEGGYYRLRHARVLFADYDQLMKDFPQLAQKNDGGINEWLLDQLRPAGPHQPRGDLHRFSSSPVLFPGYIHTWLVDTTRRRSGLRMKGGGRTTTFLVDDRAGMLDVKTRGFQPSANGLLPLTDALKELAYQRLFQRLADLAGGRKPGGCGWETVRTLAIIETGLCFRSDIENPATGFRGDRCVLAVRQAQSRLVTSPDEVVFYSVATRSEVAAPAGRAVRAVLSQWGVTSEQQPHMVTTTPAAALAPGQGPLPSRLDQVDGDWNLQADALLGHLVDFSHWYCVPGALVPAAWRMSTGPRVDPTEGREMGLAAALKLGCEHFPAVWKSPDLLQIMFGTRDETQARAIFAAQKVDLQKQVGAVGTVGHVKPAHSWSWFLETDDSEVMQWTLRMGRPVAQGGFSGCAEDHVILDQIERWLPTNQLPIETIIC
ncbi:hypothetical protein PAPYR_2821 [Paratrimastix pyriformis]|uniref:Uncharacterized protein n=1 Tax=Paratrimastix pyriformis TaxID=342808 RepID=A0ABQ8URK3_9EUKA|nr:hypothetical protein PAPYR_2821 [Paratrimastix pyriformis]